MPLPNNWKIRAAMSVPRLGFQDNFFCWVQALAPLGISPAKYDGALWGQCLERAMEKLVETDAPPDWILTVDYDSVFTRKNVEDLIRLAAEHPEADAICPLQAGRDGAMLGCAETGDGQADSAAAFDAPLLKLASGHFGLTLIKVEKLKTLPHPWFWGQPNEAGRWHEGRIDDDVSFWKHWAACGNSLYLANHVGIGHSQLVTAWFSDDLKSIVYQRSADFWKQGPPAEARR